MGIKKIYFYLYFSFYKLISITNKLSPEWASVVAISVFDTLYLLSFIAFLNSYFNSHISYSRKLFLILMILIFFGNYFLFLKKDTYKEIDKMFNWQNPLTKGFCFILISLYIYISISLFNNAPVLH
jgi:L-cystine uptake protein TcyP (sodium:dicarboxylate symporter family)